MSITVMHRRRGTVVPIKMSIFDAFRGAPDPKPRKPKPCSCCGKVHGPQANAKNEDNSKTDNRNIKAHFKDKKDGDGDLDEDDLTMLRMKAENGSAQWQDILGETSYKSGGELRARWGQIKHRLDDFKKETYKTGTNDDKKNKSNNEGKKKENDTDKEAKARKKHEKELKQPEAREKKEEENAKTEDDGKANEKKEDAKPDNEDEKSKDKKSDGKASTFTAEQNDLKSWAEGYDKKKWHIVASKHYDKTGQRITPVQARKMVEGTFIRSH
ncbi:uncharacterized protein Z518_05644 [Rhinocladiella mackenziei CBS 650.93]|uniref:Myb-like domain-containing protein n=1 Tax=Rhinocladiella mackenziei CBS 650.93 TaxID=1442369 RepID=A0A0D2IG53_9EURO|nr:uncharacterized protein Z518_05644 [Rhinocladiella mackenziei CBS 650.93]KIX04774.1 hypothetical protein Z518_05644 [Rhinocladiella mackenziei CBS 650.93]